jgi:hypothetical protein
MRRGVWRTSKKPAAAMATGECSERCGLTFEFKDYDAGFTAFELIQPHGLLRGGYKHGIAAKYLALTHTAGSSELKLEANETGDFHPAGEFWICGFHWPTLALADRGFGKYRNGAKEHRHGNEQSPMAE